MKPLKVIYIPDPILKTKALPVNNINDEIRTLLNNMVETMYEYQGIGLAANQVGILKRVIVIDVSSKDETPHVFKMVNPIITKKSSTKRTFEEGCLSIPSAKGIVERPDTITVEYYDENGKHHILDADGLLSTCIQHEIDHLDGILFMDYLSKLKQSMIKKKVSKYLKNNT